MSSATTPQSTIFLYTEEQRGNQLVESIVLGTIADISASEKWIVVRDPHSDLKFVYRVHFDTYNLDAVAITDIPERDFDGTHSTQIDGISYRLGTPEQAVKYLRKQTQWIQVEAAKAAQVAHDTQAMTAAATTPAGSDGQS